MAKKQIEGQLSLADFLLSVGNETPEREEVGGDDDLFEKEYRRLMDLFDKVKTDDFDPMKYLLGIVNGVKTAISEKLSFKDALSLYVNESTADAIAKAFSKNFEQELFDIVGTMHDEI